MSYPEFVAASLILAWSAIGVFAWTVRRSIDRHAGTVDHIPPRERCAA